MSLINNGEKAPAKEHLIALRQRYNDARSEHQTRASAQAQYERSRWFSPSRWELLGYKLKGDERTPIIQYFQTAYWVGSYDGFHACDVEIRPGVWSKMLRACGRSGKDCKPTLLNRRRIHVALVVAGQTGLATRLKHSLTSKGFAERDRCHRDWLKQMTDYAASEAAVAHQVYSVIWQPMVEMRRQRALRRTHVARLQELGVDVTAISDDVPTDELRSLIERTELERDRPRVLDELDLIGISRISLPTSTQPHEVLKLMQQGGYLCTIPNDLDRQGIFDELQRRGRILARWVFERFPERIVIRQCHNNTGRSKLFFEPRPPRRTRSQPRFSRKPKSQPTPKIEWQKCGF
ncbi:MAG: hypothetical protein AABP62_10420 [Planctomycetota bacterium]